MTDRKKEPSPILKKYSCERTDCRFHNPRTELGACNYMMITGKSKIAQLSAEERKRGECHLYEPEGTTKEPPEPVRAKDHMFGYEVEKQMKKARQDSERSRRMRELYEQGLNDCEIAEVLGITSASVWYWRSHRGLASRRSLRCAALAERLRELYRQGLNDAEIARDAGCIRKTVVAWRERNGLPNNLRRNTR